MFRAVVWFVAATVFCAASGGARADEVRLRNGDRMTGKVVEVSGGKLKLNNSVAGDVSIDLKDVETFSTEGPIEVRLKDGTVRNEPVAASQTAGSVAIGGSDVDLGSVKSGSTTGPKWTGALVVGGLITRGNTNTESLNVSLDVTRRGKDDRISAGAGYIYSREADPDGPGKDTTADNWFGAGKYDYFFTEKFYGYASLRVEHDSIADLNLRVTPSVGVGYQWVETPTTKFGTEAGLAWVYEDYEVGDTEDHVAARLAYHFERKFNDKVSVLHNLEYLPSLEDISDYNFYTDAGVRASLTKAMFAQFKVEWRYDATPAPDAHNNDLRYVLGVGWTF